MFDSELLWIKLPVLLLNNNNNNNNTCENQSHFATGYSSLSVTGPKRVPHTHRSGCTDGYRGLQRASRRLE